MNLAFKVLIILLLLSTISLAQAADSMSKAPDRWFARDKIEHFSYSVFCAAATAKVANRHFEIRKERSLVLGVSVSFSLGVLKEGIDFKTGKGTSSKKDLIWDIAGTITGALIAGLTL
jgi:uncharacterized protein YfiM (DUF2279 family)